MKNVLPKFLSRISTKLISFVVIVAIIPLIIASYFLLNEVENNFIDQSLRDFQLLAEAQEGQVLLYLDELEIRTVDEATDGFLEDHVAKMNLTDDDDEKERLRVELDSYLRTHKLPIHNDILGISVLDTDGNFLDSINLENLSDNDLHPNFLEGLDNLEKGKATHGGIFAFGLGEGQKAAITVAANIYDQNTDERLGTIINYFSTEILNEVLIGEYQLKLGAATGLKERTETLDIYLVNHDKLMVSRSRFFGDEVILKRTVDTVPVNACINNKEEMTGIWDDYRGIPVMGAAMCLTQHGDLTLVIEIDEAEILQPILKLKERLSYGILGLLIFMILSGIFIARRLSRPIVKLTQVADDISKGKLDTQVDKKTLNDKSEIGDLARAFNRTVVSLKLAMRKSGNGDIVPSDEQNVESKNSSGS